MITVTTANGVITYEPVGPIQEILLQAKTPESRAKLERHISDQLAAVPKDLLRFSLGTKESIDEILNPGDYAGLD